MKRWILLMYILVVILILFFIWNKNDSTYSELDEGEVETKEVYVINHDESEALEIVLNKIETENTSRRDINNDLIFNHHFSDSIVVRVICNSNVDWKEECLDYANNIIKTDKVSKSRLMFLLSEKDFTGDEIEYAIENVDVDWLEEAEQFVNFCIGGGHSETSLKSQMIYMGFTNEEINHAFNVIEIDYVEECVSSISYFMDINDLNEEDTRFELEEYGYSKDCINEAFEIRHEWEKNNKQ